MSEATLLDLDAMMDGALDAIPDAPEFLNPPPGAYRLSCKDAKIDKYKNKAGEEGVRIKLLHTVVETKETKEIPVPDGSMFSETFQGTEEGLGFFKSRAKGILNVSDLNGVALRDILESLKGAEFDAVLSIRKSKGKDGTEYENVQIRIVPPKAA